MQINMETRVKLVSLLEIARRNARKDKELVDLHEMIKYLKGEQDVKKEWGPQ